MDLHKHKYRESEHDIREGLEDHEDHEDIVADSEDANDTEERERISFILKKMEDAENEWLEVERTSEETLKEGLEKVKEIFEQKRGEFLGIQEWHNDSNYSRGYDPVMINEDNIAEIDNLIEGVSNDQKNKYSGKEWFQIDISNSNSIKPIFDTTLYSVGSEGTAHGSRFNYFIGDDQIAWMKSADQPNGYSYYDPRPNYQILGKRVTPETFSKFIDEIEKLQQQVESELLENMSNSIPNDIAEKIKSIPA